MQANKMSLENRAFPLYTVLTEAIEVVSVTIAQKTNLDVVWVLDDPLTIADMIVGDALRIRQSKVIIDSHI
jgi:hypothetical protein